MKSGKVHSFSRLEGVIDFIDGEKNTQPAGASARAPSDSDSVLLAFLFGQGVTDTIIRESRKLALSLSLPASLPFSLPPFVLQTS